MPPSPLPCFNPTLVRLRPAARPGSPTGVLRFQSHAGSIEAKARRVPLNAEVRVSIPRWFD